MRRSGLLLAAFALAGCAPAPALETAGPEPLVRVEYVYAEPDVPEFRVSAYVTSPCILIDSALPGWRTPMTSEFRRELMRVRSNLRECASRQDATRDTLLYILGELDAWRN